jgi:hypothetical protein
MTAEREKTRPAWQPYAIIFVFFLPVISGVVDRLTEPSRWFRDYNAVACGAERWLENLPIYSMEGFACPGIDAMPFVYHPWIAEAFAWPLSMLGQDNLRLIYIAIYVVALLALGWLIIGRKSATPRTRRAWFAAFMSGSTVYWGNLAIILHALIGVIAIQLRKRPSLLVLAIALAAIAKPIFLTFAVVFLVAPLPLWRRVAYAGVAIALGAAPTIHFVLTGGEMVQHWRELLDHFVYVGKPGDAYLGWLNMIGLPGDTQAATIGYVAFAGIASLAAVIVAEALDMADDERAALGLSVAVLCIPRLMSHDMALLGLGFAALLTAITAANAGAGKWFGRVLLGICIVALVGNLADLADWTTRICTFLLALTLLGAALWAGASQNVNLWRALWSGRATATA